MALLKADDEQLWPALDRTLTDGRMGINGSGVRCATRLTRTGRSYRQTFAMLREFGGLAAAGGNGTDLRISALEELDQLIRPERGCAARETRAWRQARTGLGDHLFADLLRAGTPFWEWTMVCLRAPNNAPDFSAYTDHDRNGGRVYRADYVVGDQLIAEGVLIPESHGGTIVEWDETLRLPRVVSQELHVQHTAHFYFDPGTSEVALLLSGRRYADEPTPCLDIIAQYRRSMAASYCACRLVMGALPMGVPSPGGPAIAAC